MYYIQEKRNSFNTGEPENSGFNNIQLRQLACALGGDG
jgi:hypothetical protein